MSSDFDDFDDDDDDEILEVLDRPARQIEEPVIGLNRHVQIVTNEVSTSRQTNLDGHIIPQQGPQYEEIREVVTFGPTHHQLNYDNLESYIYPTNFEVRDYQFNIVKKAFYDNLLCALPTGLGKTFIASTVMLNFYRWTKTSKLIFMAPTRPLVAQQIHACCSVAGIPAHDVAILLDKTKKNRAEIWETKRVFFTTPQVVENDLASGAVDPKQIVLLVVDEAHRAKGNYAYNNVVKFIQRFNNSFRILALTATPSSDVDGVQEIVNNLSISKIEVRTEESIDTRKYMKQRIIDRIRVQPNSDIEEIVDMISVAILPVLEQANKAKIFDITDPAKINSFMAMEASQRITKNPSLPEGLKWHYFFILQILGVVGQAFRRLNIYGIRSFYAYFKDKYTEFTTKFNNKKSTNKIAASFYFHHTVKSALKKCETLMADKDYLGHPKLEHIVDELLKFFNTESGKNSRAIIFTEFRESALDIVRSIDTVGGKDLRAHIFIGQSKEKEKFDEDKYIDKITSKKKKKKNLEESVEPSSKTTISTKTVSSARVHSSEDAQLKGMNQQRQKELIRQFKSNEYNILVATSIGEEGLDIGEVDLIICFDSTSSPIKNVQRMGRTGRKRDGKIILLFASNEESKFDKAMGGYEYIQTHMMESNVIDLQSSDRIIPKKYEPICEKKFIEIPEENTELAQAADDEDEIIRIATQHMNGSKTKDKASKKTNGKQPKFQKRFNMPDNVETGFRSASKLVRKIGEAEPMDQGEDGIPDKSASYISYDDIEIERKKTSSTSKRNSDILNLLDSDSELSSNSDSEVKLPIKKRIVPRKQQQSHPTEPILVRDESSLVELKRPEPVVQKEAPVEVIKIAELEETQPNIHKSSSKSPPAREIETAQPKKKTGTLGMKRRKVGNIIDQIKHQHTKLISPDSSNETIILDEFPVKDRYSIIIDDSPVKFREKDKIANENLSDEFDDFDDDLDDDFCAILEKNSEKKSSPVPTIRPISNEISDMEFSDDDLDDFYDAKLKEMKDVVVAPAVNIMKQNRSSKLKPKRMLIDTIKIRRERTKRLKDVIYKNIFDAKEGFLTEKQEQQLYTYYFTLLDSSEYNSFYDPSLSAKRTVNNIGNIGHSSKSFRFMRCIQMMGQHGANDVNILMNEIMDHMDTGMRLDNAALRDLIVDDGDLSTILRTESIEFAEVDESDGMEEI